ncbi:MAG TPA: RNA polymerase sigma factor [Candidatus Hydrogenedentes bacterium]|nr:RNA polymerase sigma factor [Candidatus Hydrogenedentota bacterium]
MTPSETYTALKAKTDEQLMRRSRSGDEDAFALLVRRYEAPLYRYLFRMLQNSADAEDVFQETFLRIYRNLHRFREDGRFKPWAYRIAANLARDRLRARKRRSELPLDDGTTGNGPMPPQPDAAAGAAETARRVEMALSRLPAKQRSVFLLARYEGLAYGEIARMLRIPVGTVKSRMNKAAQFLLRCLEQDGS